MRCGSTLAPNRPISTKINRTFFRDSVHGVACDVNTWRHVIRGLSWLCPNRIYWNSVPTPRCRHDIRMQGLDMGKSRNMKCGGYRRPKMSTQKASSRNGADSRVIFLAMLLNYLSYHRSLLLYCILIYLFDLKISQTYL